MLGEEPKQNMSMAEDKDRQDTEPKENLSERARVKEWQSRIKKAREKFKPDFDRMRDNMDFVTGLQWKGQKRIQYSKYVVNMTLRAVNQGVAMLYAKNPQVDAVVRERLLYKLWDEKQETIIQAQQISMFASQANRMGIPLMVPPDIQAVLNDYQQGRMWQALVAKVARTLKTMLQYQMDQQNPSFKLQMKQLVRRVNVCGVGYIKVKFCRSYDQQLTQSETRLSAMDRAKTAIGILERLRKGKIDQDSADVAQLQEIISSLQPSQFDSETVAPEEHLSFEFPQATSIIPDPSCRMLKGFVGAHWVAEEFYYPLQFVNDFFETKIEPGGDLKLFSSGQEETPSQATDGDDKTRKNKKVRLWEVMDLDNKSKFVVCEGYKDYVSPPQPCDPSVKGFWNVVPVTFNDVEVEEGCESSIFPPSAVDLIRPAQIHWNDSREALKKHRTANRPRYLYPDGIVDEKDLDRIANSDSQEFIKLKSIAPNQDPGKVVVPLQTVEIKKELYDTEPLREDILLGTGQQEANLGPPQPNVTATASNTSEQSRMSVAASDVDGLDDSLTEAMSIGGEMLLREASPETVTRICGAGAVFPQQNREDFLNQIDLKVVAGSSGRPNKVLEVSNWKELSPLLMQAAQLPPPLQPTAQAIIRQTIKVLDANVDPADYFPNPMPQPAMPQAPGQENPAEGPSETRPPGPPKSRGPKGAPNKGPSAG